MWKLAAGPTLIFGLFAAIGCSEPTRGLSVNAPLSDGGRLSDLLADNQRLVVLSPADCYSCAVGVAKAVLEARQGYRTAFVFTRRPSEAEARELAHLAIPVDAILAHGDGMSGLTPATYLVQAGGLAPEVIR